MSPYATRRARVLDSLGQDAAMILPAAPQIVIGRDVEPRYRQDSDLWYLTGYPEPEAVAVLCPAHDEAPFTLFVRPRDPDRELWTGARGGLDAARDRFGADAAWPISQLEERLPRIVNTVDTLYFRLGAGRREVELLLRDVLIAAGRARQRAGRGPHALIDSDAILGDMRIVKDEHEIELIRRAAAITAESFRDAASVIRPGAGEWELEAELEAGFRRRGAEGPSFTTIVASGENATVLHYVENAREMASGDLVLVDAGASYRHYAGDVSRTFPVSGRFSPEQRALYETVLAAHDAAIAAARPGATVPDVHAAALRELLAGLLDQRLLEGEVQELLEDREQERRYRPFFPHQTSHWLGLDVHDVGTYAVRGEPRALRPGMVLTIEPALYLPPTLSHVPAELRGIGIRIEDDILVTDGAADVLTSGMPAAAEDVEGLVGG